MKTIPILLQQELDRPAARLAKFLRIIRRDGNVYRFTSARRMIVVEGELYLPAYSFLPTDIATASDLDTDDVQVEGLLSASTITEDDIRAGRWDYAQFWMFTANWASPSDGIKKDRAGRFGKVTVNTQTFIAEMLGMLEAYSVGIGKITQPGCRTSLGSPECTVVPTSVSGTVSLCETDFFTCRLDDRSEADAFFEEGVITFDHPTGPLSYEVKAYVLSLVTPWWTGPAIVTKTAIAYDVTGMPYAMTEGCPRTFNACRGRFSNAVNFRGEPWLRGVDVMVQSGRHT